MKHKFIIFIFLVLVFSSSICAAPPFLTETIVARSGIQIAYPQFLYYTNDDNLRLNFHAYNSTGYLLNNLTTNCSLHIYDQSGNHVAEGINLTFSTYDFYYDFNITSYEDKTSFHYIVTCVSSQGESGYVASGFELTNNGLEPKYDASSTTGVFGFIVFITVILLLLPLIIKRFNDNVFADYVLKRMCIILGMLFITFDFSIALSIANKYNLGIIDAMYTILWILNWTIYVSLVFSILLIGKKSLDLWKQQKHNEKYGEDNEAD